MTNVAFISDSLEFELYYKKAETVTEKIQCFIAKIFKARVVTPLGRIVLLPKDYDQLFETYTGFPFVYKE